MKRTAGRRSRRSSPSFQERWSLYKKPIVIVAGLAVICLIGWLAWNGLFTKTADSEAIEPAFVPAELEEAWTAIIRDYEKVSVGIEVWDVSTKTRASVNSLQEFRAASVTKMITAAFVLSEVAAGRVDLSDRLSDQTTLQWNLEQMVRLSSNDAWKRIRDKMDRRREEDFAYEHGLSSFNLVDNTISTDDMARLMRDLASGQILDQRLLDMLESYMTDTYEERFLAAAMPEQAIAYHKAGTLEDDVHEVAIVEYKGRDYAVAIMTNGNGVTAFDVRMALYKELMDVFFAHVDQTKSPVAK